MEAINTIDELCLALAARNLRCGTIERLKEDVLTALVALDVDHRPRHALARNIVADVFIEGLGIAVKCATAGHASGVHAELYKYAEQRAVEAVLLVSSRRNHAPERDTVAAKPLRFVCVAGNDY